MLRTRQRAASLVALVLLATACGSTATQRSSGQLSQPGLSGGTGGAGQAGTSGGLAAPAAAGSGGGTVGGPGTAGTAQGGTTVGSGGTTGFGGSTSGTPATTSGATGTSAAVGPGVSATEILIGRSRITNAEAANKAFGNNVTAAPTDQYDKAMVDYINSHGGAAGRKLKLNYYTIDGTGNKGSDQIEQEECAQWTQDHRVFAVLTGGSDNLRNCLAKKGVPQVYENVFSNSDRQTFSTFRSYYEINAIDLSHLGDVLPDQLAAGGYFTPGAKLGLLTWDDNQYMRAVSQNLKPALARRGLQFVKEAYVKTPKTAQEQGEAVGSLPNFVLAFKQAGVDHVIVFGDSGAALLVYFDKAANSQQYSPTYGLTSASAPQTVLDQNLIDGSRLHGAVAAGWNPTGDVGVQPYTKYGAGYKLCASIMAKAGVPFNGNSNNTVVGSKTCDAFFFLAAALNRGAPNVTLNSFTNAAESLGGSYASALTYGVSISSGARDGVAVLATNVYDGSCTCFKYKGDLRRLR